MPFPVPVLVRGAFVVLFLALRHANAQLGATFVPVQIKWHERVALALHGTDQAIELVSMQQQFTASSWIRLDVRRCGIERWKVGAK